VTLCKLIDREDLLANPRFADRDERKRFRQELKQEIEKALTAKPAQEWSVRFNEHGVPAGEVLSIPEVLEHPQVIERRMIKRFATAPGVDRDIATVRAGFKLGSGDPAVSTAPPALGADTEQILLELGYDLETIAQLRSAQTI
jgi:crotonobetainyl-CoA:carnitine CoA-transferase CaiB-like acyl-CoA transferase